MATKDGADRIRRNRIFLFRVRTPGESFYPESHFCEAKTMESLEKEYPSIMNNIKTDQAGFEEMCDGIDFRSEGILAGIIMFRDYITESMAAAFMHEIDDSQIQAFFEVVSLPKDHNVSTWRILNTSVNFKSLPFASMSYVRSWRGVCKKILYNEQLRNGLTTRATKDETETAPSIHVSSYFLETKPDGKVELHVLPTKTDDIDKLISDNKMAFSEYVEKMKRHGIDSPLAAFSALTLKE